LDPQTDHAPSPHSPLGLSNHTKLAPPLVEGDARKQCNKSYGQLGRVIIINPELHRQKTELKLQAPTHCHEPPGRRPRKSFLDDISGGRSGAPDGQTRMSAYDTTPSVAGIDDD
jgi:hypothetical protein